LVVLVVVLYQMEASAMESAPFNMPRRNPTRQKEENPARATSTLF
jgi:hypothetical protein